MSVTINHQ